MPNYPNIFTSQSKEFSQDAFIDWLLRCADPATEDDGLRTVGQSFIRLIVEKNNSLVSRLDAKNKNDHGHEIIDPKFKISSSIAVRQHLRIDVLGKINGDYGIYIIFENKLGTSIHHEQPTTYRKNLRIDLDNKGRSGKGIIIGVYYKVLEETDYDEVEKKYHFCTLSRAQMRDFLADHVESNPIIQMYHDYLVDLDARIHDWRNFTVSEMLMKDRRGWAFWSGWFSELYQYLKPTIQDAEHAYIGWGWINNADGGFHALWIGSWKENLPTVYLQCEEGALKARMSGRRTGATMSDARDKLITAFHPRVDETRTIHMRPNAKSAEIGDLGPYVQYGIDKKPSIPLTAQHILAVFRDMKTLTGAAPERQYFPGEQED